MGNLIYEGNIESLNNLSYSIDSNNNSWIKEEDIISSLCKNNSEFYMEYFTGKTYLNLKNVDGKFPLLHVLIAAHQVFELIADADPKTSDEADYEKLTFPFIIQLAKIGARELGGKKTPLNIMEEMLLKIQ